MKKYTKHLFFFSFFMSLISLLIIEKGHKEMYPFASWKLFTVPSGGAMQEERYVLYGLRNLDTIRITHTNSEKYEANDKALITDFYGKKIEKNDEQDVSLLKLKIFANDIEPNYQNYLLYREVYNPKEIGEKNMKITKTLITKL